MAAYARVGDSRIVYSLSSQEYAQLTRASYNDLRHRGVITASFDDIDQIAITLEGEDYVLTSREEDGETVWKYTGDEELDISELKMAVRALKAFDADSFTDEEPADTDREEIGLTVHLDNETWPEIAAVFYRHDGNDCLAVVNGEPFAYVPRSEVVDLIEAVYAIVLN